MFAGTAPARAFVINRMYRRLKRETEKEMADKSAESIRFLFSLSFPSCLKESRLHVFKCIHKCKQAYISCLVFITRQFTQKTACLYSSPSVFRGKEIILIGFAKPIVLALAFCCLLNRPLCTELTSLLLPSSVFQVMCS